MCIRDRNKTATVATLDKEDIKRGLVNFMIRYQEAGYDDMYIQYMGEGYWDKTVSGNNTAVSYTHLRNKWWGPDGHNKN